MDQNRCESCGKKISGTEVECFRCRVSTVGFSFHGGAIPGRDGWNRSREEFMLEHLGTTDDRELAKKGIERVKP